MTRFLVTYRITDKIQGEVEIPSNQPTMEAFIAAAYEQGVVLPSLTAEIEYADAWEKLEP